MYQYNKVETPKIQSASNVKETFGDGSFNPILDGWDKWENYLKKSNRKNAKSNNSRRSKL